SLITLAAVRKRRCSEPREESILCFHFSYRNFNSACRLLRKRSTGPAREPEMHMKSDEKRSLHWAGEGFLRIELRQLHTIRPDTRLQGHLQDPVQRCGSAQLEPFSTETMCSSFSYQNAVKDHVRASPG
ncbi:hypothetical protein JMJ77_0003275, partial [Colletotrichum scovillei]